MRFEVGSRMDYYGRVSNSGAGCWADWTENTEHIRSTLYTQIQWYYKANVRQREQEIHKVGNGIAVV